MQIALEPTAAGWRATVLDDPDSTSDPNPLTQAQAPAQTHEIPTAELAAWVARHEADAAPRWIWADTSVVYPRLLAAGVRVERCVDLRLCRRILRTATAAAGTEITRLPKDAWDAPPVAVVAAAPAGLFDLDDPDPAPRTDAVQEHDRQRAAVRASTEPGVLALLLAAESAGSLVAAEMSHAGLPWDVARHDEILVEALGARDAAGRPAAMERRADEIRRALDLPDLNPDSAVALLKGLQTAGLQVTSTSKWELQRLQHPVIAPLLAYKKQSRLLSANGWNWIDTWVRGGRFRPVYVVGGVVTGRWASDGGGALQLPHDIRDAVRPDPGWKFVVADASQLEPRVLAAMSGDAAMARAGQAHDMYLGMVESGAVSTREEAKYGMLGAIYGGTSGVSGRMLPRITRAFPRAMALVEQAARDGEQDRRVRTWLGRTSPVRGDGGFDETRTDAEQRRAREDAKAWGRFTRNFVVQGTAAEWALCWMGSLRRRLWQMGSTTDGDDGGPDPFRRRPHLVFFLHDELIVHAPAAVAEDVAVAMREAAAEAGRILFPVTDVEFAITVAVVDSYADAK
ncbi:MAG: bifunctional 3'-5' exonuclease/DNA polymerase [Microbacteriaceae bacterium]